MRTVYLAGPILGTTEAEAKDWRNTVASKLYCHNIRGISPLRCEPIVGEVYGTGNNADPLFGTARAISSKNFFDVQACDMTFAYMPKHLEKQSVSIGTILEIGWAYALRRPVVLVTDDPYLMQHPVLNSCAAWLVPTLDDGIELAVGILGDYVK